MVSSPHRRNLYNPNTKASITTRTKHHQEQTSCLFSSSPTIMKASGQLSDAAVSIVASQQQGPVSKSRLGFVCLGGISLGTPSTSKKRKKASLAVGINVRLLWWGCDRLQPLCAPELDKWKGNGWMDKYILKTHKTKKPTLTFYERENFIIRKTTIYVFIYFTSCTPTAPHYFHKLPLSLLSSISIMFL